MPDVRHMDFSLNKNLQTKLAKELGVLAQDFCQAIGSPYIMRRLEDAFTYHLQAYADYTRSGMPKSANSHRHEVQRIINRAEQLSLSQASSKAEFSKM